MPELKDIKKKPDTYASRYKSVYGQSHLEPPKQAPKPVEKKASGFKRLRDIIKGFAGGNVKKSLDRAAQR